MSDRADKERLLNDVLAEEGTDGFREALFDQTLVLARRRRGFRHAWRAASFIAVIAALGVLIWRNLPHPAKRPGEPPARYEIVESRPLPPTALVATHPLSANDIVATVGMASVITTTADRGEFREISDDALLALAGPRPAALVRLGPHAAQLIVLDSQDEPEAPPN